MNDTNSNGQEKLFSHRVFCSPVKHVPFSGLHVNVGRKVTEYNFTIRHFKFTFLVNCMADVNSLVGLNNPITEEQYFQKHVYTIQ